MATLDDLNIPALTDMSVDEGIEHLRQLRLSRRTPVKKTKTTIKKAKAKATSKISTKQAQELLKLLGDSND